ncbi:MAG: PAS domain S-box protein [Anaerolineales bacterium]
MKLHEFFLSQSADAILLVNSHGVIVEANEAASTIFEYSKAEIIGQTLGLLVPERFHGNHIQFFKNYLLAESSTRRMGEFRDVYAKKKGGIEFPAQIAIGKGDLEGESLLIAIVRNTNNEKNTDMLIRSLALFPEENPNPVIRIQRDGKVLFANASGEKLLRLSGQVAVGFASSDWLEEVVRALASGSQFQSLKRYSSSTFSLVYAPVTDMDYVNIYALDVTEREKVTAEMELSDQILKSIGNMVLVANGEGKVVYISESVRNILGYEPEEVLGDGWWNIERISGGDIEAEQAYVRSAARGETFVDGKPYEHRVKHRDGTWRWLMLGDAKGPRDLLIGIGTDITHLKSVENELQEQRDFAYALMQTMGQGLTVTNSSNAFEYINPAYATMLGYTPEELIGKTPLDVTLEEDREILLNAKRRRQLGEVTSYESRLRHANGTIVYVLITGVPRIENGVFGGTVTVVTNLNERLTMEAALRQSEESMRSLYIISSSQEHFYNKINKLLKMGAERFGLENGMLSNIVEDIYTVVASESPDEEITAGTVYDLAETYCSQTIQAGEPICFEHASASEWKDHPCFTRTKLEAYFGVTVTVNGRVYGTLNFASAKPHAERFTPADNEFLKLMSQWVSTELERLEATHQLEAYASEIARNNKELAVARDRALEASRLKSAFLATMSHEIRTPMNAVIGMNEILLETNLDKEQRELATVVENSAQSLLTIINDILDFSKIEAGKLVLHPKPFDVHELVREVVNMFSSKAQEKGLRLDADVVSDLPHTLIADAGRIRQVLINLLGNALKFTESGVVKLYVNGTLLQDIAHVVTFSVKDTGIGISEKLKPMLFEPFSQADGTSTRRYGGTGLGLAISHRLVDMMDGEMGFDSTEGDGSTFWFSLPLGHKPLGSPSPRNLFQTNGQISTLQQFNLKKPVLIVEDDEANRNLISAQLHELNLSSYSVSTGREAIELLTIRPHDFALTLMDVNMPEVDGISATRIIRQHETKTGKHSVIIAVTANAMMGDRETCISAGMDDYIAKPAGLESVSKTLARWVSRI